MRQNDEQRREYLAEAKILAIASPVLLPLIQSRKKVAYERLLSGFREGKSELTNLIAELNAYDAIERDIINRENDYKILEERQNGNAKRNG